MNEETVNIISAWQLRLAELSRALAAAQQAQREAEVERDEWQHAIERSQAAADAQFKRAETAEAALSRARETLVRYLKQLGTQAPPGLTKAQASELINAAKAAQIARKVVRR